MAVMFGLTASMNANAATTSAMTTSSVTAASSSSDWDSILDSYEKYVNEYIAVYKKVQSGDMSAYSKMASLMEKYHIENYKRLGIPIPLKQIIEAIE